MSYVDHGPEARNTRNPSKPASSREPELTRGGNLIRRRRPHWSASVCNAIGALAGISQEVHHG